MEITLKPKKVVISRNRVADMLETLDEATTQEQFLMLTIGLSMLFRMAFASSPVTLEMFTDRARRQIEQLVKEPPKGFRDEDLSEPTPGCDCDVCKALKAIKERRARAN